MSVLVDTSVWVDHFRHGNDALVALMALDRVLTHPMVVLELACGTPPAPRRRTLDDIGLLRAARQATPAEVLAFVEQEKLYGLGCGLVDLNLLASTLITPDARLWTLDRRLRDLAARFGVAHSLERH
ncbi:type II toxin-antitoxin system VapC family toxin [Variovorax boronicumulans]|uniref:type II toxin-antitoxin system VapC family toxin n=1 Tax=Variovorax boronicumulans TaxID=436515 RepID=UPI001C59BEFA